MPAIQPYVKKLIYLVHVWLYFMLPILRLIEHFQGHQNEAIQSSPNAN